MGVLTNAMTWQAAFAILSVVNFAAAAVIWWRLPQEHEGAHAVSTRR